MKAIIDHGPGGRAASSVNASSAAAGHPSRRAGRSAGPTRGSAHPAAGPRQFGEGPLAHVTAPIYSFLILGLLLLATSLPTLISFVLLSRDASNAPLAVACVLPVGPALSAALYALRHRAHDLTDLRPAAGFWRGYKMNAAGVLRLWVPWLAAMALIAENLTHSRAAAIPGWWRAALVVIAVAATLWMLNALLITSLFAFRPVDVARLAAYFLGRTPGVTLGNLGVLIGAAVVVETFSEAVLALFAVLFAAVLLRVGTPMTDRIERDFTA